MNTELVHLAEVVRDASSYLDVFGPCDGDTSAQSSHVKRMYRRLAKILHPDRYTHTDESAAAKDAFARLETFHQQAEQAIADKTYGQPVVLATIQSRKGKHVIRRVLVTGDLCTVYVSETVNASGNAPTVCKVAMRPADNDLLEAEARALKRLRADGTNVKAHPFVPELMDSFMHREPGRPNRRANVLRKLDGFYTLEQLRRVFPNGLDPLHMAWIWRRLVVALYHAHVNNVVHGAVLPSNILIEPENHGVVLIDWCYSSIDDGTGYAPIKAIVGTYKDWYPAEVLAKTAPSPATDIAMAARCMIGLMGGDPVKGLLPHRVPKQFRAFFRGCLPERQNMRPDNALKLQVEFDELLERMGEPYYPRRFRPLIVPTGAV